MLRCNLIKCVKIAHKNQHILYYFKIKTPSNLRHTPLLKRDFQGGKKGFASKYISLSAEFTSLLAWALLLQGKSCS